MLYGNTKLCTDHECCEVRYWGSSCPLCELEYGRDDAVDQIVQYVRHKQRVDVALVLAVIVGIAGILWILGD